MATRFITVLMPPVFPTRAGGTPPSGHDSGSRVPGRGRACGVGDTGDTVGMRRDRFEGTITGVGTTSGVRAVVGRWIGSPLGPFTDVMVESADGRRTLVAPDHVVAGYVADTYRFDEVSVEPVVSELSRHRLEVRSPTLRLDVGIGDRTALGRLLAVVPDRVATAPWFAAGIDPVARRLLDGVRTRGSAGNGRREWYGATDVRSVATADGTWQGVDIGELAPVWPPVRFGFGSVPPRPSVVWITTTVEVRGER
jgi:hypothetical protein